MLVIGAASLKKDPCQFPGISNVISRQSLVVLFSDKFYDSVKMFKWFLFVHMKMQLVRKYLSQVQEPAFSLILGYKTGNRSENPMGHYLRLL